METGGGLRLSEPAIMQDVWIDGIGNVERLAANVYRVLLYRTRQPCGCKEPEHEAMISIIASTTTLAAMLAVFNMLGGDCPSEAEVAALLQ